MRSFGFYFFYLFSFFASTHQFLKYINLKRVQLSGKNLKKSFSERKILKKNVKKKPFARKMRKESQKYVFPLKSAI